MNRYVIPRTLALFVAIAIGANHKTLGQIPDDIASRFIPKSAVAGVVLFPQAIAANPKADLFPREIVSAWGQKTLGVDPMSIASIVFLLDQPNKEAPPHWGCVFRFGAATELAPVDAEKITFENKPGFRFPGMHEFVLVVADDRTLLLGPEAYLSQMLASEKVDSDLCRMIAKDASPNRVVALVDIEAMRPFLDEIVSELPEQVPPQLQELTELHQVIDSLSLQSEVDPAASLTIRIHTPSPADAQRVDAAIQKGLEFARQMIAAQTASQLDPADPIQAATMQYVERLSKHFQELAKPTMAGNSLEFQIPSGFATTGVLISLLLPAVQKVREAARRTDTANRVRQILLTLLNYESAYRTFPADICDADGKPLLSWRVTMLRFIDGQEKLYEQFHLDEPWDSEHNLALLEHMPEELKSAGVQLPPGMCNLLGVSGPGTLFEGKPVKIASISDGTSNTIAVVEVNPDRAVPWTQPGDWIFDPNDPLSGLGGVRPAGFNVGFVDGSVQHMKLSIDPETWKALLTIAGGEVIGNFR